MSIASHDHVELVLNGHIFTGWSDDELPYELRFEPQSESKMGHNGNLIVLTKPTQAATLFVRLAPHSPSTRWCIERYNERVERDIDRVEGQIFTGTLKDVAKNIHYSLNGGFIVNLPGFTAAYQTYEGEFMFERVVPNVSGGRFADRVEGSQS